MVSTIHSLRSTYNKLSPKGQQRAKDFFRLKAAHERWMENRFLETLHQITSGQMISKLPADAIQAIDVKDPRYFDVFAAFSSREDHYREVGKAALAKGELLVIDLAAGMATGFGKIPKASVAAQLDTRYVTEKGTTYLDLKRNNYLKLQMDNGHHLLAAAMVSEKTEEAVRENLQSFADANGLQLIYIEAGTSRQNIINIWKRYQDEWERTLIVPIIRQPSTLLISKDGREVGEPYMKGHGDFYDVVQSQLKDLIEITGIKYIFTSNIDNTGGLVSRAILGNFIEQAQQNQIEAFMEAAEKFEGDKGGVPAMISGRPSVLEEAFVPDEWRDRFMGRETFPYSNTNSFWFVAATLMDRKFNLPLMISKEERTGSQTWLKVESIMAHGLSDMSWKALVIDRGMRFTPAKFLTDLWIGRTNWMTWIMGRLLPAMRDGKYVPKPLLEVSKKIMESVADLDKIIFRHGAYDYMARLQTMMIGGEGNHFHEVGDYKTFCPVAYEDDVAIIFGSKQGQPTGTLTVAGASLSDRITLRKSILYIRPGENMTLRNSVDGYHDPAIGKKELKAFLKNADRWPPSQQKRVMETFFPPPAELVSRPISLDEIVTDKYLSQIDELHRRELQTLNAVFKVEGSLVYDVEVRRENDGSFRTYLKVRPGSKTGSAQIYPSRADSEFVPATDHKASTILPQPSQIFVDPVDNTKGAEFAGKHYIAVPDRRGNRIMLLIGEFDETLYSIIKDDALSEKYDTLVKFAADRGLTITNELKDHIRAEFYKIKWADYFEHSISEIYNLMIHPVINPIKQ